MMEGAIINVFKRSEAQKDQTICALLGSAGLKGDTVVFWEDLKDLKVEGNFDTLVISSHGVLYDNDPFAVMEDIPCDKLGDALVEKGIAKYLIKEQTNFAVYLQVCASGYSKEEKESKQESKDEFKITASGVNDIYPKAAIAGSCVAQLAAKLAKDISLPATAGGVVIGPAKEEIANPSCSYEANTKTFGQRNRVLTKSPFAVSEDSLLWPLYTQTGAMKIGTRWSNCVIDEESKEQVEFYGRCKSVTIIDKNGKEKVKDVSKMMRIGDEIKQVKGQLYDANSADTARLCKEFVEKVIIPNLPLNVIELVATATSGTTAMLQAQGQGFRAAAFTGPTATTTTSFRQILQKAKKQKKRTNS